MRTAVLRNSFAICTGIMLLTCCMAACNGDEDIVGEQKGKLSFAISKGDGNIDTSAPITLAGGDSLHLYIRQSCSYTDTDGKVFTCAPEATIKVSARMDTLCVADLATLTRVKQTATPTTTSSGTNPVLHKTVQTFDIGGQEITFHLSHEVYQYVNAANATIEMPYVKPNPARFGAAETADTTDATRVAAAVTGIRLTPVEPVGTRGYILRDSTMYKVTVSFNTELESRNTGDDDSTTPLTFEMEYIGVVTNATEMPDPAIDFSYQLNILSGTDSEESPFELTKGNILSLEWAQDSRYTYFSETELVTETIGQQPKATMKLTVEQDTIQVESVFDIEKVEEESPIEVTSGDNPTKHSVRQSFNVGGQKITVDYSYDSLAPIEVEGEQVPLPYLELGKAEVENIDITELENAVQNNDTTKIFKAYEVRVSFRQKILWQQMAEGYPRSVLSVVKYIAVLENKLISTTYEKDYQWFEAHDNLPPRTSYILRRIRTYASGEKIIDTFVCPGGWPVETGCSPYILGYGNPGIDSEYRYNDSIRFVFHAYVADKKNDYYSRILYIRTGVPDIYQISWLDRVDTDDWDSRTFDDYIYVIYDFKYDSSNPVEGWYVKGVEIWQRHSLVYGLPEPFTFVKRSKIMLNFYDRFLYLDGQVLDFPEFRMTYDSDFREESITLADGTPAKVFTHSLKAKYLGRDFYVAAIDTVYQLPKTAGTNVTRVKAEQAAASKGASQPVQPAQNRPAQPTRNLAQPAQNLEQPTHNGVQPPFRNDPPRKKHYSLSPFAATPILTSSDTIKFDRSQHTH